MSTYTECIFCKSTLHYKLIEQDELFNGLDLPYCPNTVCPRYGLYTMEGQELLADKVVGFTEKESSSQPLGKGE